MRVEPVWVCTSRGAKGATIDAGSRVPFVAWGPVVVQGGAVSQSLVDLNDILPTLAALAAIDAPVDYPGDGQNLLPVLRGEAELPRESIFIHYEPFWPTGKPATYVFDRRWKLYEEGGFYDYQADPLERSPLDVATLEGEARAAHRALEARLGAMPGELQSRSRWLPRQAYYLMAGLVLALLALCWLCWRTIAYFRRRSRQA